MANLTPTPVFSDVYQLETTDPGLGGPPNEATGAGMLNIPLLHLANRTEWLKSGLEGLTGNLIGAVLGPTGQIPILTGDPTDPVAYIRWGEGTVPITAASATSVAVTFAPAFAKACVFAFAVPSDGLVEGQGYSAIAMTYSKSPTGAVFSFDCNDPSLQITKSSPFTWLALGY